MVISAFVLFHVGALSVWTNPDCLIKSRCAPLYRYYMLPLGLWQWWAIFAPDPLRDTLYLNVEVIDAKGLRHLYEFPKIGDLPWWQKLAHYRDPKFAANMPVDEYAKLRVFTARHVVRQLGLKDEAFPLTASLYYEVRATPPPGTPTVDPMAPKRIQMLDRIQIASLSEVRP
jgi:hypothetical protein